MSAKAVPFSGATALRRRAAIAAKWLDRPRSTWWCVGGWIVATIVFIGVTTLLGGLTELDSLLSTYSTWFIAHGNVACAYPPGSSVEFPLTAPLYPVVTGGLAALFRIGHTVPFPTHAVLGPTCLTWLAPMTHWSTESHALTPTLRFGYLGWFTMTFGVVSYLRASGRGRNGWEPAALLAVAITPPVFMCLQSLFHPQDLVAIGLILAGAACARRNQWLWAGVLVGLACTSQQFSILALATLLVIAPRSRRLGFCFGAIGVFALIVVPLMALSSGRALRVALIGTGQGGSLALSIPWELHLNSTVELDALRALPIVVSLAVAMWAKRKLGGEIIGSVALISLIGTSLSIRLVFEGGLYGYYFMAVAVSLVVMDVVRRRFRIELILWLTVVALAFSPLPWGHDALTYGVPMWIWQVLLVPAAVALAIAPLVGCVNAKKRDSTASLVAVT